MHDPLETSGPERRLQYALPSGVTWIVMQKYDATQTESLFRSPSVS